MMERTQRDYFDRAYQQTAQAFGQRDSWYERRKRAVLLASLPKLKYNQVFEPGCGDGRLSDELLERCDHLLAMDWSTQAPYQGSKKQNEHLPHLEFAVGTLPEQWPENRRFDLIVISELLYYFTEAQIVQCAELAHASLASNGTLALIHWLHPSEDYPTTGKAAHEIFLSAWPAAARLEGLHVEHDFSLIVMRKN